jgi:hypothetical protein
VFDGMRLRVTAAGHGLAGGEIPQRLASGLLTVAPRAPLGLLVRRVTHQSATAFAAWSAPARALRWCWRGYLSPVRGARDVHVKARAGVRVHGGVIDTGLARHGVDTDGAAALMLAPWVAADSTAAAGLVRTWERRLVAKRALAGQEGGAPSSASTCARQPVTARPWWRRR